MKVYNYIKDKYTLYEEGNIHVKKALSPINIEKGIYKRMTYLLKVNPELEYKSRTHFVEKTLTEKLDVIENNMVLKSIKEEGIVGFKAKTRKIIGQGVQLREELDEIFEKMEKQDQVLAELKKKTQ